MFSGKEGCTFWLISGWFVPYLDGLWVVWMIFGWFRVLQLRQRNKRPEGLQNNQKVTTQVLSCEYCEILQSTTGRYSMLISNRTYIKFYTIKKCGTNGKNIIEPGDQRCSVKKLRLRPATLLKKRLQHRCFPMNFAKFLRTPFFRELLLQMLLNINIIQVSQVLLTR